MTTPRAPSSASSTNHALSNRTSKPSLAVKKSQDAAMLETNSCGMAAIKVACKASPVMTAPPLSVALVEHVRHQRLQRRRPEPVEEAPWSDKTAILQRQSS